MTCANDARQMVVAAPPGHRLVARQVQRGIDHRHGMAACAPRGRATQAVVAMTYFNQKETTC